MGPLWPVASSRREYQQDNDYHSNLNPNLLYPDNLPLYLLNLSFLDNNFPPLLPDCSTTKASPPLLPTPKPTPIWMRYGRWRQKVNQNLPAPSCASTSPSPTTPP